MYMYAHTSKLTRVQNVNMANGYVVTIKVPTRYYPAPWPEDWAVLCWQQIGQRGTVTEATGFKAEDDIQRLRGAMKGAGKRHSGITLCYLLLLWLLLFPENEEIIIDLSFWLNLGIFSSSLSLLISPTSSFQEDYNLRLNDSLNLRIEWWETIQELTLTLNMRMEYTWWETI